MQCIYLKNKSYSVENLPSEPSLLIELLELCHSNESNFELFATSINKDIGLTTKIMQVANSPAYRQWNELTELRRMLIVLGMTNVKNIVTTCAIQQFFANFTNDFNRNVQFIWLRAIMCANLSARIAKLIGYKDPGEAFLAGLLHQVGMLLLLLNRKADYLPILERYYTETDKFKSLEQQNLNVDHCELGCALIESWGFDSFLASAVNFQQAPAEELATSPTLIKIIAAASPLSSSNNARKNTGYIRRAGQLFDLTEEMVIDCIDLAIDKSQQMVTALGYDKQFYMQEDETLSFDLVNHEAQREKLAEKVKNIALSNPVGKSDATDLVEFTKEIRATFNTLFNLDKLFFFTLDKNQTTISAVNDLKIKLLDEVEFTTIDQNSFLVKALNEKTGLVYSSEYGSIADRHVIKLLESDIGYYLPIHHAGNNLGVLALGITAQEWPALQKKTPLLKLLGHEIARKYLFLQQNSAQNSGLSGDEFKKIAHEISNPLTIINNYLYVLGKKMGGDHGANEDIEFIRDEIKRASNILLRAKDPDATTKLDNNQTDINKILTELDILFSGSLYRTKQIQSKLLLDEQIPIIRCSKDKLKQILINIIKNGVEALPEAGEINITSRDNFYQDNRQYIELTIRDNGDGINPKILKSLFKPVTSTKEGHTGLGLAIVHTLVEEIAGNISCYSKLGYGTEFRILIPRNQIENKAEPT